MLIKKELNLSGDSMSNQENFRIESDSMGEMKIDKDALYGASTQRALENFPVSGRTFPIPFYKSLALIKYCCANVNQQLRALESETARFIMDVAIEIYSGKHLEQFKVDIFQTGSGTSTNMNFNEVLANVANTKLGGTLGSLYPVHPLDHVNFGQSSNDVIPTAIHIAVYLEIENSLLPNLTALKEVLEEKADQFKNIVKTARTHLQDATPITLGQEFSGYAKQIEYGIKRIEGTFERLSELPIGGSAVGTGINTHPKFGEKVCALLSEKTEIHFKEASNHFEAQSNKDTCVEVSCALKTLAVSLMKIANDIRWLSSGPRTGIGEISLPEVQPGSSIMPGKVNPVIAESVCQVAARVMGNDLTITLAGQSGNFELNVMMPLIADTLLESISLLSNVTQIFNEKCIKGIKANEEVCKANVEKNLAISTVLTPVLGYDTVAKLTKEAYSKNKNIRELVLEKRLIDQKKLDDLLDPIKLTFNRYRIKF